MVDALIQQRDLVIGLAMARVSLQPRREAVPIHGKVDYEKRCHDIVGIFYGKVDGSHLEEVIFPSQNPNGVGLSPDGKRLYAAETYTCRLMAFNVIAPGKVDGSAGPGGPGIPLYRPAGYKFFDSLGVEECGNICVATIGECGISVVSPDGELAEFVATDDIFTTNICWGGDDMATAGKVCVAEVEEVVPVGSLDPDGIHLPGIYVNRMIVGSPYDKKIEFRTVRERVAA